MSSARALEPAVNVPTSDVSTMAGITSHVAWKMAAFRKMEKPGAGDVQADRQIARFPQEDVLVWIARGKSDGVEECRSDRYYLLQLNRASLHRSCSVTQGPTLQQRPPGREINLQAENGVEMEIRMDVFFNPYLASRFLPRLTGGRRSGARSSKTP